MSSNAKKISILFPISLILYELPLYLANNIFLPALPLVKDSFRVSNATAQLSVALWFLGASTLQVILGPLSDHYGRKKVLLSGGLIFLLATLVCATTTSITWFLACRFMQGCVASTILVTGYAIIHELLDTKSAIKTISWMGSITLMAPAVGPMLGSLLLSVMHWRGLFVILIVMASLSLILLYIFMPQDKRSKPENLQIKTIIQDYRSIVTSAYFWIYTLAFSVLFAALMAWNTISPFYLVSYLKLSLFNFGLLQMLFYGVFIIGVNINSLLKFPLAQIIHRGLVFSAGFLFFSLMTLLYLPHQLLIVMTSLLLFALSTGVILYSLNRVAIEIPKAPMGTVTAVFATTLNLFAFLGSLSVRWLHF